MEAFQLEQKAEVSFARRCWKGAELLASLQLPHHIDRKSAINAGLLLDQLQALSHPSTCTANSSSDLSSQASAGAWETQVYSRAVLHTGRKSHVSSTCLIRYSWRPLGGMCCNYKRAVGWCGWGCPRQLCSPGRAGLAAQEREQQSWRQLSGSWPAFPVLSPRPCWCTGAFWTTWESPGQEANKFLFSLGENRTPR